MQIAVGDFIGVSTSTVCRVLRRVSIAICQLRPDFIRMPSTDDEWKAICHAFFKIAKFPRVIGAIDCTHVKIQSPGGNEAENYRNRKGWFSINVQCITSADLKITNILARWPGATHDQTIFNNSRVKMELERQRYGDFIILGDSGYRNTQYLATPLLNCSSPVEILYNESQIRTRNLIERAFGVLKRRFPVLSTGIRVRINTTLAIIVSCAILHNIAIECNDNEPPVVLDGFEEMLNANEMDTERHTDQDARTNVRNTLLATYFPSLLA